MSSRMKIALLLVVLIYSLFYPPLYAFTIPRNYLSVTTLEVNTTSPINVVDYDPVRKALLLKVYGRGGPSVIAASPGGTLRLRLNSTFIGGCITNNSFKIVLFNNGFHLLTLRDGRLENSTIPGPTALPLSFNVTCSEDSLYLTYATTNKIIIYNITGDSIVTAWLRGTLIDSHAYNDTLIVLAKTGKESLAYTLREGHLDVYSLLGGPSASRIVGPGLLTGYSGNTSYLIDIYNNKIIYLEYRGGKATVEAAIRENYEYIVLTRPPGDWMHLVYITGKGKSSEVEVFYTLAYTFDHAGVRGGAIWAGGTLYNGSRRIAAVLTARGVVRGMVGYYPTLLLSVNPGTRARIEVKPLVVTKKALTLNSSRIEAGPGKAPSPGILESYMGKPRITGQYYDRWERLLTGIVLDLVVLVPVYLLVSKNYED
ncbi:MAG: hypothetical protein F7C35_07480 [Desulfurococcales archaeon]|nr:hypothetical protein [Desulfurococcales archaeon]